MNDPAIQRDLVTAKRPDRTFYVDAISTDGGCIPRNDLVTRGLTLVEAGYLTLQEFVLKSSLTPARHLRLLNRGHLSTNAIADITIVDKRNKKARATLVQGQFNLFNGKVLGEGLTFVTTERGDAHLRQAGFRTIVTDPSTPHPLRLSI